MYQILNKLDERISHKIMTIDGLEANARVNLAFLSKIGIEDSFGKDAFSFLCQTFLISSKAGHAQFITASMIMLRIIHMIELLEKKHNVPPSHSIIANLTTSLVRDAFRNPKEIGGYRDRKTILAENIPIVNKVFEELISDDSNELAKSVILNFFVILHRIEKAIEMKDQFGLNGE